MTSFVTFSVSNAKQWSNRLQNFAPHSSVYRKSQGKPLKPDEAQDAQDKYHELQNRIRARNARYEAQRQQN